MPDVVSISGLEIRMKGGEKTTDAENAVWCWNTQIHKYKIQIHKFKYTSSNTNNIRMKGGEESTEAKNAAQSLLKHKYTNTEIQIQTRVE